ncbi:hypothetical protein D9757_008463 [Collybiopsis confluens]|uniref:Uncharacterized protein n=1 Tax=Collybiopsis confluens TaxID=2823264 RepID=A0A8H5HFG0_9AGAR|nr:hypothetical protein D9757_008463 [Collybiopsis confluens]
MTTTKTTKKSSAIARKSTTSRLTVSSDSPSRLQLRGEWKASLKVWSAPKGKIYKHPSKVALISKPEAKKEYKLNDDDLDSIPVEDKTSRNKTLTTMVFDLSDVQELARRKCEKLGVDLPEVFMQDQRESVEEASEEHRDEDAAENKREESVVAGRKRARRSSSRAADAEKSREPKKNPVLNSKIGLRTSGSRRVAVVAAITKAEARLNYDLSDPELGYLPSLDKMEKAKTKGPVYTKTVFFSLTDVRDVTRKKCEMLELPLPEGLQP